MANCDSSSASPVVSTIDSTLRPKPEFDNVDDTSNIPPEQKIVVAKVIDDTRTDNRQRIQSPTRKDHSTGARETYDSCGYPGVGLLRVNFPSTEVTYLGTAMMIADGSCILTSAQMVVDFKPDDLTAGPVYANSLTFELRKNCEGHTGSTLIKKYKITDTHVHSKYFEDPTSSSGFDIALCRIHVPEEDHTFTELHNATNVPIPTVGFGDFTGKIAVVGFPAEHEGEKWGMVADVPSDKREEWAFSWDRQKEILVYDFINTSPGQSGSPILHMNGGQESYEVIGVHTGGSEILKKKWGTFITPAKLEWIVQYLGSPWKIKKESDRMYLAK